MFSLEGIFQLQIHFVFSFMLNWLNFNTLKVIDDFLLDGIWTLGAGEVFDVLKRVVINEELFLWCNVSFFFGSGASVCLTVVMVWFVDGSVLFISFNFALSFDYLGSFLVVRLHLLSSRNIFRRKERMSFNFF